MSPDLQTLVIVSVLPKSLIMWRATIANFFAFSTKRPSRKGYKLMGGRMGEGREADETCYAT